MHTVLTYKATRTPKYVVSGLDLASAVAKANQLYDASKTLSDHGLLASGVCVVVLPDADAELAISQGCLPHRVMGEDSVIAHQCGGY
jgi:small ligand-binding sensory domain FIST